MAINKAQAVELPKKGSTLKSMALKATIKTPFVIYADLEALLVKLEGDERSGKQSTATKKLQRHVACSYGYKVVCCYDDQYSKPFCMYRGEGSIHRFF